MRKRWSTVLSTMILLLLVSSCSPFNVVVPPASYSTETALVVLANGGYKLLDILPVDGFEDVVFDAMVGVFRLDEEIFLLYVYKSEEDEVKEIWKKLKKKFPFTSIRISFDFPNFGKISARAHGKEFVVWRRGPWLFLAEGGRGISKFVEHVQRVYSILR